MNQYTFLCIYRCGGWGSFDGHVSFKYGIMGNSCNVWNLP